MKQSVTGWEDLSGYRLDNEAATEPLDRQTECTFVWVGTGRHPIRAVVDYLFRDGRFWVSATDRRPRVAAVRSDPRVSLVVSSKGSGIADPPLAHLPGALAQHIRRNTPGGELYVVTGRYDDTLRRTADGWRFTHRTLTRSWSDGNPAVLAC
ncbi:nuclear transport factor 2 family protein [Lentzea terrae]|uniref:nuclear transport factor 2 family protein n=1 Tax=Lentzea terrae TaxID=2200761 RepID=UPI00130048D6|nr:nuclear transport factor 2 family protein [Lentzea terrae]